jgi:integrase
VFHALPDLSLRTPWRAMYALGALAGLRPGEVIGIEWPDVDFDREELHVRRQVERSGGLIRYLERIARQPSAPRPKDRESRHVPMTQDLKKVLTEWRRIAPVGPAQVFPATSGGGFARPDGTKYIRQTTLGLVIRRALKKARLGKRVSWGQATRHSFASRALNRGVSLDRVAQWLGHSTAEVTRRYAHLLNKAREDELAAIEIPLLREPRAKSRVKSRVEPEAQIA